MDISWTIYVHIKYGAVESGSILLFQGLRCWKEVHCHYCVVQDETCTLYTSLFRLLLIWINSAVKWQDLIYSNKRSMQQKGDNNHIIVVSKTSYFKFSYYGEKFAFLCYFCPPNLRQLHFYLTVLGLLTAIRKKEGREEWTFLILSLIFHCIRRSHWPCKLISVLSGACACSSRQCI